MLFLGTSEVCSGILHLYHDSLVDYVESVLSLYRVWLGFKLFEISIYRVQQFVCIHPPSSSISTLWCGPWIFTYEFIRCKTESEIILYVYHCVLCLGVYLKYAMDCIFCTMNVPSVEFVEINCECVCGLFGLGSKYKLAQVSSCLTSSSHFQIHPPR